MCTISKYVSEWSFKVQFTETVPSRETKITFWGYSPSLNGLHNTEHRTVFTMALAEAAPWRTSTVGHICVQFLQHPCDVENSQCSYKDSPGGLTASLLAQGQQEQQSRVQQLPDLESFYLFPKALEYLQENESQKDVCNNNFKKLP